MIVKGWELMKMIAEGKIKAGSKFKFKEKGWYFDGGCIRNENDIYFLFGNYNDTTIINGDFEILEDEINIDKIEEVDLYTNGRFGGTWHQKTRLFCEEEDYNWQEISDKINELIKAVKQLNKKLEDK